MQLLTSENCGPCKSIKDYIEDKNIQGIEILQYEDNVEEFKQRNIRTVPVLITEDGTYITNAIDIISYLKAELE